MVAQQQSVEQQLVTLVDSFARASERLLRVLEAIEPDGRLVRPVREASRTLNRVRQLGPSRWSRCFFPREALPVVNGLVTATGALHTQAQTLQQTLQQALRNPR